MTSYKNPTPTLKERRPLNILTEEDILILSQGLLCMIDNTNKAISLSYDTGSLNALEKAAARYRNLNDKLLLMSNTSTN